jgi:hypothetical protein
MNTVTEALTNCTQCKMHEIIPDPDPNDWFCDDDVAVVCKLTEGNPQHDPNSRYMADRQNVHRCITRSCRPYNTAKETLIPNWCPKLTQAKTPIEQISDSIAANMQEIRKPFI